MAPLAVAVGAFGVTFGVLAGAAGFGSVAALVFSATTFAGSAQFAASGILSAGGTFTAAILAAVLLNARYLPIGLSVAPELGGSPLQRLARAQIVVDESWAVSHIGGGRYDRRLLLGAGLTLYLAWLAGTALGVAGGDVLGGAGGTDALGLDAAFPALFLGLLAGQVRSRRGAVAAVLGAAIALALVPLVPAGIPIVAASVVCLLGARKSR